MEADTIYTGKVVRDGHVAVLYSPGFGAGWSTWNGAYPELMFDPALVKMVEQDSTEEELVTYCSLKYPGAYLGGLDLRIEWVKEGTLFRVTDYDGNESVEYNDELTWLVA